MTSIIEPDPEYPFTLRCRRQTSWSRGKQCNHKQTKN